MGKLGVKEKSDIHRLANFSYTSKILPGTYGDSTDAVVLTFGKGGILTNITTVPIAGGGGGSALTDLITQVAHGFVVGNVVRLNGTTYVKALADSAIDAEVIGIVSAVADANDFTVTTSGLVTGLSGFTAGTAYYLDPVTAGALTATEPSTVGQVSKPIFVANTTTSGYVINFRGEIVSVPSGSTYSLGPGCDFISAGLLLPLSGTLTDETYMPYNGAITAWTITGDVSGSASIVVAHSTYAAYDTMTTLFTATCSSAIKNQATGLSYSFAAGDILRFTGSGFSNFTRCNIVLTVTPS